MTAAETSAVARAHARLFEDKRLTTIIYNDTPWWIAREVGAALNYADHGGRLVDLVMNEWRDELDDQDRWLVIGEDLKAIKAILNEQFGRGTSRVPSLLLLSESGIYKAALLSRKPEGRRLRDWLSKEVLPEIRQTGKYLAEATVSDRVLGELQDVKARLSRLEAHALTRLEQENAALRAQLQQVAQGAGSVTSAPLDMLKARIQRGELGERFSMRDVYVKHWAGCSSRAAVEPLLDQLVAEGWLSPEPEESHVGRPSAVYRVDSSRMVAPWPPAPPRPVRTPAEPGLALEDQILACLLRFPGGLIADILARQIRRSINAVKPVLKQMEQAGKVRVKTGPRHSKLYVHGSLFVN